MLPDPKHFTDREAALAAYDALWQAGASQRVLNIEGMSGNGKSTLLWFIEAHHDRSDRPRLRLSLDNLDFRTQTHALLDALAEGWEWSLPFGALDGYRAEVQRQDGEERAIIRSAPITVIQDATGGSTIENSAISVAAETNLRLAEHRRAARAALTRALAQGLRATWGSGEALLLLDTYEVARQGGDGDFRAWLEEGFVPTLLRALPGLRVVIAGREELPFEASRHSEQTLSEWTRPESDHFLASWGMMDAALQGAIFALCRGHPLLTDIARTVWQEGQRTGQPLTVATLRADVSREGATQWLIARLRDRLPSPLREALTAAALLRRLSHAALNAALGDKGPLSDDDFARLLRYSFVQPVPGTPLHQVHDLVRQTEDEWNRAQRPDRFRALHERALLFYTTRAATGDGDWLPDQLYHHLALEPEGAMAVWWQAMNGRRMRYDVAGEQALLAVPALPERWGRIGPGGQAEWHFCNGLLEVYQARLSEAEVSYNQALSLYRQIEARLGEANTLVGLGDLYQRQDRLSEAEANYNQALAMYYQTGNRGSESNALISLGDLYQRQDRLSEAEASYNQALPLCRQIEYRLGEANCLVRMGELYQRQGRLSEAEASYNQALPLHRQIRDRLGEANTLKSLGQFFSIKEDTEAAEQHFAQALELYEQLEERYSIAATLTYRGQYRLNHNMPEGLADWGVALPLAISVDPFLFQQVLSIQWNDLVDHLRRAAFALLSQGIPLFVKVSKLFIAQLQLDEEQRSKLTLLDRAFLAVGAVATWHVEADETRRAALARFARETAAAVDGASRGKLGVAALVDEVLR